MVELQGPDLRGLLTEELRNYAQLRLRKGKPVITTPPPFKGLKNKIPIITPIKGREVFHREFVNRGSTLRESLPEQGRRGFMTVLWLKISVSSDRILYVPPSTDYLGLPP